jgi:membrane protein required for colicin V production
MPPGRRAGRDEGFQHEYPSMNTVDIIVIAVVALSALIAFVRGFVREMLTVGSWMGASLVTLYGFPVLQPLFERWIPNSRLAAHLVCGIGLFIGSLVVFSVFSHFVAKLVRGSALTAVDRSLGLLFGLARGAVLVSLAYMIVSWLQPSLIEGARTEQAMKQGAKILRSLAPKELSDSMSAAMQPSAAPANEGAAKGEADRRPLYKDRERDALQRLIDTASPR